MAPPLIAGLLTGLLLGAVGGGGSILLVPLLVLGFGLDAHTATGTALGVVAASAAFGAGLHARRGAVRLREAAVFALPGMLASAAMTPVNARLPEPVILGAVVVLMLVVAARMWRPATPAAGRQPAAVVAAAGLAAGALTGLLGVGGGFIVVPALVLALGMPMPEAVGTSLAVIAANALAALGGYAARGDVDGGLVLMLGAGAAAGVVLGTTAGRMAGERRLRQSFAVLLVAVAGITGGHEAWALWM